MNLFEEAVRFKFRFPYKGLISVEDLWDLPLKALDEVFKTLNAEAKKSQEESLLATKDQAAAVLEDKIEIVKYIVRVKQEAAVAAKNAAEAKAQKQKILEIISRKEDAKLEGMSLEDLRKLAESL